MRFLARLAVGLLLVSQGCSSAGPSDQLDLRTDQSVYFLPPSNPNPTVTLVNHTNVRLHWLACPQAFWLEHREGNEWISDRLVAAMCINQPPEFDVDPEATFHGPLGVPARVGLYRVAFAASGVHGYSAPFAVAGR